MDGRDDFDFQRKMMDEATEKLNQYIRALLKQKKGKQVRAFGEEKYEQIALTGFIKRIINALILQNTDNAAVSPEKTDEFVRQRLSGKMKISGSMSGEADSSGCMVIDVGEGVSLRLQRGDSGNYVVSVCVPLKNKEISDVSDVSPADPDMPDGKEEAKPLSFAPDRLDAFCRAAEYIFDNAREFKKWAHNEWKQCEKYKYLDYPKKDVLDKIPVYWWWAWLKNASEKDLSDLEFIKKLVARRGDCLQYALPASKSDRTTVLGAIKETSYAIIYASEELQNDREFVLQALNANRNVFGHVREIFRDDREIALSAVKKEGSNLQYVSERLKNDPDVVEAALAQDLCYLCYASEAFRDNKEYVMRAVRERGNLLAALSERLKADRDVVLSAVTARGKALQYAPENMKNDREVVLAAVKSDGNALEFASELLRNDREIVLTAVENSRGALAYASDELRDDREIAVDALKVDKDAWHFVSDRLQSDLEFIKAVLTAGGYEIVQKLPDGILKDADAVISLLETLSENPPDMDDYGEFADGTSEYYDVFKRLEDAFCRLVEKLTAKTLKNNPELLDKICDLTVSLDSTYYDEGDYPYEYMHTRLPDRLKAYFEKNKIPCSGAIEKAIEAREAKKYHQKEYSGDIPLEERLFLEAGDYYEWLAEKIRRQEGGDAFAEYLGPQGAWIDHVMERFVKSLIATWKGLFHDDELWRDEDYAVDLDKAYEEISRRLSSKMEVKRNAFEFYYSENVEVFVNEKVRFELVRELPLKILELWVNDYDTDRERGFWVAPDRLDVFCNMAEYIQENYGAFEKKAEARAAKLMEKYIK